MYSYDMLISEVSEADPCGPDLDLQGDINFMNFMAFADSALPASFFRFDRSDVDLAGQISAMKPLLQATRDLRLLVTLAKYQILDRQFEPFVTTLSAIATLVTERWQAVNPQGEDGDFALRVATLESLDDMAQVILPLQHQALFRSRKTGAIALRTHLIASGTLTPRENEEAFDAGTLDSAIAEADIREIVAARDLVLKLKQSLVSLQNGVREGMDFRGSVSLERLSPLVDDMNSFLEGIVQKRDPTQATGATPGDATAADAGGVAMGGTMVMLSPPGAIRTLPEVDRALKVLGRYFALKEPSSPALLLVRQAQSLVGKNFFEGIRALMPAHAAEANIVMGMKPGFDLSVERLAEVANEFGSEEEEPPAEPAQESWGWSGENAESVEQEAPEEESAEGEAPEEEGDASPDGASGEDEQSGADQQAEDGATNAAVPNGSSEPEGERIFKVNHRPEAFALISAIQEYYNRVEPASPIPMLLERARNVGTMDFLALMRLVMPQRAFRSEDG